MIAALFVETNGVYYGRPDVEPWDRARDARLYSGPHSVVAHPPCERWGRYWSGGPNPKAKRRTKGDDGGCFAAALAAVRKFGGVLEHPEGSAAWLHFGLLAPRRFVGWRPAGDFLGWTCCVEQGHYGHHARKATWLYAARVQTLPSLKWGPSMGHLRLEEGFHTAEEAKAARTRPDYRPTERLSHKGRLATPREFADILISIAEDAEAFRQGGRRAC
jgi:hypothetical protein